MNWALKNIGLTILALAIILAGDEIATSINAVKASQAKLTATVKAEGACRSAMVSAVDLIAFKPLPGRGGR